MFHKLVMIEPAGLLPETEKALEQYAETVEKYDTAAQSDEEIIRRLAGADAVLVCVGTPISGNVIRHCPDLRYIGMCCSFYQNDSCSVDWRTAHEQGILVTGVNDYGDEGVPEYVIAEMVMLLHGFHGKPWGGEPLELTGFPVGVIGAGATGVRVAKALHYFGADVVYTCRSPKEELNNMGIPYVSMEELLKHSHMICTCISKFTVLVHREQLEQYGHHKIIFNTGLSPSYDTDAMKEWLSHGDNHLFCDSDMALGDDSLREMPGVSCPSLFAGKSRQSSMRLSKRVLENLAEAADSCC